MVFSRISTMGLLCLSLCATVTPAFAFTVPVNDGFVTDDAHILTAEQVQSLDQNLQQYQTQTSNEIAILIVPTLSGSNISDVSVQVGRAWGVGTKDKSNGILMLIAYQDHEINIATGYGLEGAIPDIVAKVIVDTDIVPAFRNGKYYDGLSTAVDSLKKHIGGEYTAARYVQKDTSGFIPWIFFFVFIVLNFMASIFARTKSWWLGGIVGGFFGIVLTVAYSWWLSIPLLVALGLFFDYIVSKNGPRGGGRNGGVGGWWGGMGGGGGGSSGGFGGFGGGSFGGGGASGKW